MAANGMWLNRVGNRDLPNAEASLTERDDDNGISATVWVPIDSDTKPNTSMAAILGNRLECSITQRIPAKLPFASAEVG